MIDADNPAYLPQLETMRKAENCIADLVKGIDAEIAALQHVLSTSLCRGTADAAGGGEDPMDCVASGLTCLERLWVDMDIVQRYVDSAWWVACQAGTTLRVRAVRSIYLSVRL